MTIATATMKEALAATYASNALFVSLHTADPGATGANEVVGGTPAYARKALTWTNGAADGTTTAATVTFDVPATTVTYVGIWSDAVGGTFLDKAQIPSTTYSTQSTHDVDLAYVQL